MAQAREKPLKVPVSIRGAVTADFDVLYALDRDCYPPGIAYTRHTLRWFLAQPGAICLIAEDAAGAMAGFILADADPPEAHIVTIDVAEDWRRKGVGSVLLESAEMLLETLGVATLELETATSNAAGVAFWKRHGYLTTGVLPGYYLDRLDAFQMRREFAARKET